MSTLFISGDKSEKIKRSSIINKKSIIHHGLLKRLNFEGHLKNRIYFRYDSETENIYVMYEHLYGKIHTYLGTFALGKGHKKFLEMERNKSSYPVLIEFPEWFFKNEKTFAKDLYPQ